MKHRYDNWVGGLNGDWLISRQRFFGIPFPVWYPLDDEGEPDYDHPLLPREDELPIDPSTDAPARLRRGPARQAGRLHRRPRRDGHLGDLVADPADRRRLGDRRRPVAAGLPDGPVHPGARHHPHLAVLAGWCARTSRTARRAVDARADLRLRRRPRPQEDVEVQGQRRRPDRDPRQVRRRRRPLARRDGAARAGLALRRDPDEGRPPAGDEGAQRLASSCSAASARPAPTRPRSPSRSTGRCSAGWRSVVDRGHGGLRAPTTTPPRWRSPSGSSGSSATTTSSWSRSGPTPRDGGAGHRVGPGRPGDRAARPAAAVRAVPALRDRGGLVVVAGGLGAPRSRGPRPRELGDLAAATPALLDAVAAVLAGIRGAKSTAKVVDAHRAEPGHGARSPAPRSSSCGRPSRTCGPPAGSSHRWSTSRPSEMRVEADLVVRAEPAPSDPAACTGGAATGGAATVAVRPVVGADQPWLRPGCVCARLVARCVVPRPVVLLDPGGLLVPEVAAILPCQARVRARVQPGSVARVRAGVLAAAPAARVVGDLAGLARRLPWVA